MGLRVGLAQIVGVVGDHHGQACLLVDAQDALVHHPLVGDAVILELQIEVVLPEDLRELQGIGLGVVILPVTQSPRDLSRQAGAEGNKSSAVGPQQLQINAGLDIKALHKGHGHQIAEIPVPLLVPAQQHQMAALRVEFMDLVKASAFLGSHIDLAADDRLDALSLTGSVEIDSSIHNTVVCDGAGCLP